MIKADIITIGSELLKGTVLNTNSRYLSQALSSIGFQVQAHTSCEDSIDTIEECLSVALSRSEVVVMTGGLGPTPDDVTREAVAHYFKTPLVLSKKQWACIQKYYRKHQKGKIPAIVKKEAEYPQNAKQLINRQGIALGFYVPCGGSVLIVLPGVPREMQKMVTALVLPLLKKQFGTLRPKPCLIAKIVNYSEATVMEKLGRDFFSDPMDFGIYPAPGEVILRIYADKQSIVSRLKNKVKKAFGASVYSYEEKSLQECVGERLIAKKKTLAVAESCTGGLLASILTEIPGASQFFKAANVVYSNSAKETSGVAKSVLKKHGAVSKEVAKSLAQGVRLKYQTSFGVGITGIAGPSGGTKQKPVGLVFICVADAKNTKTEKRLFWGNREQIREKAAKKALEMLWHFSQNGKK